MHISWFYFRMLPESESRLVQSRIVDLIEMLSGHLPGETEENLEIQSWLRQELNTSWLQVEGVTATLTCLLPSCSLIRVNSCESDALNFRTEQASTTQTKTNSVALVRERTIPIERFLLVGKVSAKFCG
jgi:hypothetical protein